VKGKILFLCVVVTILLARCASEPASKASDEVVLVYTGATRSFLDLCGFEDGQMGGLARRATVIRDILGVHPHSLVLDAGGLFDGHSSIDKLRCETHLDAMGKIGYHAANVGLGEFRYGSQFLNSIHSSSIALVSSNLTAANGTAWWGARSHILEAGGRRVGIVGVTGWTDLDEKASAEETSVSPDSIIASEKLGLMDPGEAIRKQIAEWADGISLVVVLSDLSALDNRRLAAAVPGLDVIIGSRTEQPLEKVNKTMILGTLPLGKGVGKAVLRVDTNGILSSDVEQIPLGVVIAESRDIAKIVDTFYTQVANDPQLRDEGSPRFVGYSHEETVIRAENVYTGAEVCADCHPQEYRDWSETHHANAFNTLLLVQKHFQPDCVTCHSTGFGYPSGFAIGENTLRGVQCETCHGPGGQHVRRPEKKNIRGNVDITLCENCHDDHQTPDLAVRFEEMVSEVDHNNTRLKQVLREEITTSAGGKPTVELFVMALCPYAMEAESALAPTLAAFEGQIDFKLHFIAEEAGQSKPQSATRQRTDRTVPACESDVLSGSGRFRSLHGDSEIAEGIRQVAIMTLYPDRYFEYILCRNQEIYKPNWASCAQSAGMDPDRIRNLAGSEQGQALFRENIRRANLLGIDASPTLLMNGREVQSPGGGPAFARSICAENPNLEACAKLPVCNHDRDCSQTGKVGICLKPGEIEARCTFKDPVAFEMVVLNAADCALCETGHFIRSTLDLFPGVVIRTVEAATKEGQDLVNKYGIDRLPAFIIDSTFEQTARFGRFERTVRSVEDAYLPEPIMIPITQLLDRETTPGTMEVFLDANSPFSMGLVSHLMVWLSPVDALDRAEFLLPGSGDAIELQHLCVQSLYPDQYLDFLQCRARILLDAESGQTETGCLDAFGIEPDRLGWCSSGDTGFKLSEIAAEHARQKGVDQPMVPAVVIDNRIVITGAMVRRTRDIFYGLHPEILARDGDYLESRKQ